MKLSLKLFSQLYILIILLFTYDLEAKLFPKNFHNEYQLLQNEKSLGKVVVDFSQNNNQYKIKATTKAEGIMKLLGNREVISTGQISSDGFMPMKFQLNNKKNPKKNITAIFNSKYKQVQIKYKQEIKNYVLKKQHFDVLTYLYQFNFESLNKEKYIYEVVDGKKSRIYSYNKVKSELIETGVGKLEADVYKGQIQGKNNSKHYIWILKKPYRIPLRVEIKTDIGININQILVNTNLISTKY